MTSYDRDILLIKPLDSVDREIEDESFKKALFFVNKLSADRLSYSFCQIAI